ncbi:MAG: ABC transporter ATP-binding protein [Candidatus Hydrogenedentes bacterium]|nr:ABC transporter ATP-binding protein [Candidatus Hydrogenedentota bacterium]
MALLTVDNMRTHFHTRHGVVRAVDGISFAIEQGGTLGIVGESGSGKSVAMLSLLGLLPMPPARIEGGSAAFAGLDLLACGPAALRGVRGRRIGMVFQDPMTALNPYMRIGAQLMEPLLVHAKCSKTDARARAVAALESVGIQDASSRMQDYPHQFSGGMRQRVMIAMALIAGPELLIADEPTTALDVTVQAQILDVIKRLQAELGMAVVLITHDLGVIAGACDDVAVMYAGRFVESASAADLFRGPRHPYTRALMRSIPSTHDKGEALFTIPGAPPDLGRPIEGCPFAPRCAEVRPGCRTAVPELAEVAPGHRSACLRVQAGDL